MGKPRLMMFRSPTWKRPRRGQSVSKFGWEGKLVTANFDLLLHAIPFVGIHAFARVDGPLGQRAGQQPNVRWRTPNVKKKAGPTSPSGERHLAAVETALLANLMPLVEHMAVTRYDDGDPRVTGWLRLGTLGAAWTLDVKDPDTEMSFRLVDSGLDRVLENASLLLACDEAPWSADPYLKRKGPPKKK